METTAISIYSLGEKHAGVVEDGTVFLRVGDDLYTADELRDIADQMMLLQDAYRG